MDFKRNIRPLFCTQARPCKQTKWDLSKSDKIFVLDKEMKLGDVERPKLISSMKDKVCLWANGKFSKPEKSAAVSQLVEAFGFKFTGSAELLGY